MTQTNAALSGALAGNANETDQWVGQSGGGVQAVGQKAGSEQDADAESNAFQFAPSNDNTAAGGSGGGDVTQTNAALSGALAGNANETTQSVDQSGDGVQAVGQFAFNKQDAKAKSNAIQLKPSNSNTPVSVGGGHKCGCPDDHKGGGDVTQTNLAGSLGIALNKNSTGQSLEQKQYGDSCKCHGGGLQVAEQKAASKQDADAESNAIQLKPSNSNTPVSVGGGHKCGCPDDHKGGGDVTQTNLAGSLGIALNKNSTDQSLEQKQYDSCKCGGGEQVAGQFAFNDQYADAESNAVQVKPSNDNTSVGGSGGGDVTQTNAALSGALAGNANETGQWLEQSGGGVQVALQKAASKQDADAKSNAIQFKPSNSNTPVSVGGGHKCGCTDDHKGGGGHKCGCPDDHKGGGDVRQANIAAALGIALNANSTDQYAKQSQHGGSCKCGGGVQAVEQGAWSKQDADASANAFQFGASNGNTPVRIGRAGGGGSVFQANLALALGLAANLNRTDQGVSQSQI